MPSVTTEFSVAANDTSIGYGEYASPAWNNPSNALTGEGDDYSHLSLDAETSSNYLKLTGPVTPVPTGVTVDSVEFEVLASTNEGTNSPAVFTSLKQVVDGSPAGNELRVGNDVYFGSAATAYVMGGDSGLTLTPESLNDSGSGVAIQCSSAYPLDARIHRVRRIVHYSE